MEGPNTSTSLWQEYMVKNPSFTPPSAHSCHRYLTSYHKNGKMALIHRSVKPENLHFALRAAMLALGALYLFEDCNARALFEASKSVALEIWLEQPQDATALHFKYVCPTRMKEGAILFTSDCQTALVHN